MTYNLILLRHGNSVWNQKNIFTGWVDVDLSDQGRKEAKRAGELLEASGLKPDVLYTSMLKRAINTAHIALDQMDRNWIPTFRSWRLNERHYGSLQGLDKAQTLKEYGPEQFQIWRRSFDVAPPRIADDNQYSQAHDERYQELREQLPRTECLKDVLVRMMPFWDSEIVPSLKQNKTVLIAAHGNSLRALVKELDGIGDQDVAKLNIPTGIPLLYQLSKDLKPLVSGGEYLDPEAALAGAKAVANQGNK
jgi:2,3-bisphosphoglycerate-dependent phosphoglycerate mutase